ncbi:uncharacterized protein LOC114476865 [Gouania willdenowi]|uniref:uncharacterized protein LOC114476865 n=1 Tax=Gouania willdenowi TaxID=441366 RepID=UPI0010555C0D|nr:uncharacterized protein LOC114476865 [Gouania willdenowi]
MFRISLVVCVWLILGITAKPWDKLKDEAFQETVVSIDGNGKLSWGIEVEPPEDMDILQYEIDPRMQISKSMTENADNNDPMLAEVDLDERHHPSVAELLRAQMRNFNLPPSVDIQEKSFKLNSDMQVAELDEDEHSHPEVGGRADEEPEEDWDEAYRQARQQLEVYLAPLMAEVEVEGAFHETQNDEGPLPEQREEVVRKHVYPEEDMDDLYHKDVPVLYQDNSEAPAASSAVETPSQRKHSQPEEDLDHIYHQ